MWRMSNEGEIIRKHLEICKSWVPVTINNTYPPSATSPQKTIIKNFIFVLKGKDDFEIKLYTLPISALNT